MPMRVPLHCFRLAPLAENVTAQRSVTHLTLSPNGRLPTLRSPTQKKDVWYNEAGRPRSSPRRFAAIVGYADGGDSLDHQHVNRPIASKASLRKIQSNL
ncbi:MAG: hypothetical protein LBQ66_05830 [Planctomycetaceae bacterium]|nr:hypothetical protein [Planctomycetaceae bacterium]